MKYLLIGLLVLMPLHAVSQNTFEKINCNVELTQKEVLTEGFEKYCPKLKGQTIISFQLKVPKHKTIHVIGNLFSDKASDLISQSKVGDHITIFNIKVKSNTSIPPMVITIKE